MKSPLEEALKTNNIFYDNFGVSFSNLKEKR